MEGWGMVTMDGSMCLDEHLPLPVRELCKLPVAPITLLRYRIWVNCLHGAYIEQSFKVLFQMSLWMAKRTYICFVWTLFF